MSRRLMPALSLLLALTLAPAVRAAGQWTTYLHYKTCNDILALRDTVWFATGEAGLVRYFRSTDTWSSITREPNGLAGNSVNVITFDRSGNLYAGVPSKGVSRLDTNGRWSLLNAFDGLPSDTTLSLRAQGDTVWIGTTRGLAFWDGHTVAGSIPDLGTPSPFVDNNIRGVAVTGDTLFVCTPKGVHFARLSQRLTPWTLINDGLPVTGPAPGQELDIRGMACDGHNVIALASGVDATDPTKPLLTSFRWVPALGKWVGDFPANAQVRRVRDDFGIILATTNSGGASGVYQRAFAGGWTLLAGSPGTDNGDGGKLEVGVDPDGVAWASLFGRTMQQASPEWITRFPPGPIGNNCRNILWANGSVYACFDGEGIGRLRDGVWRNYPSGFFCSLPGCDPDTIFTNTSFPTGMTVDPTGAKWIGMWDGPITRFNDEVDPPRFRNIRFASSNGDSVHMHSLVHGAAASQDLPGVAQPGLWLGLDSDRIGSANGDPLGLDVYDTSGTYVRSYGTTYPGLKNGLIRAVEVDKENQVWLGYKGDGVSVFRVPDSLQKNIVIDDVSGRVALDVFGIAIHGDSVWVLAADGLHRYRRALREPVTILQIAAAPALLSVHPIAVAQDGSVYVGTTGGLRVHRRGQLPVDFTPDNSPLADFEVRGVYVEPSGVVWIGTATGVNRYDPFYVPAPPPRLPSLTVKLYPNPAWQTGIGFQLKLSGQATSYDGEIYDLNGRVVNRFHSDGNGAVMWTGRDLDQRWVEPGIYFVRVRGGGAEATSRVVVLH